MEINKRQQLDDRGDDGLFGPASVTWRLHADPMLWLGGVRALYLQALHPEAMAGIERHSRFRDDPWGRLRRTGDYVGTVTYGTREQAERAGARVRTVHRRLGLDDPDLLRWVHCCEVDSFLVAVRRAGMAVSAAEADRYVAEQVRAAVLAGVPEPGTPTSVAELAAYFGTLRPGLALTPAARSAARFLLFPPMPVRVELLTPARPLWTVLASASFGLLPRWARRMYAAAALPAADLPGANLAPVDWAATATARTLRSAVRLLPAGLREGPHYQAAKARVAARG
ncbi:MAG TPA: oxygenase MpaB family protein [Mycobacteriales bacterium]|nr:oxygenase MpaB family protein [Mycobacteriales bacterium]